MSTLRLTTLSNQGGTASVPSDTVINGTAKAWVNFNGTGTVAIRQAFNVSSITDNGTGDYTINFSSAMPDSNYIVTGSANRSTTSNYFRNISPYYGTAPAAGSLRIGVSGTGSLEDHEWINAAIFR
jgi:hypothetical protein